MGTSCCYLNPFYSAKLSDWITIFGIVVNSALAYWIVCTIQDKLTNKRVLKDHFINEIKEIRIDYKTCLNNLYTNSTNPLRVIPWFKLMNIKVDDIMTLINSKYGIKINLLEPYQNELRELITNNSDFMEQYNKAEKIVFSEDSRSQLIKFQQTHNHLFNELIIKINDAE